jgi:hypothetical protein
MAGTSPSFFSMASHFGSEVKGKWIAGKTRPERYLDPIIKAANKVETALTSFTVSGKVMKPDYKPDSNDATFAWLNLSDRATSLRDVVAKVFRLKMRGDDDFLPVCDVTIGNVSNEQNLACHALYECAIIFVGGKRLPVEAVKRFRRNLATLIKTCSATSIPADNTDAKAVPQPEHKSRVKLGENDIVLLDDKPFPVKPNGYKLFQLLLSEPGEYVPITKHNLRTRDLEKLPQPLQAAIERDPGAGTRIRREYLV